jgi:hypothetical protein
MNSRDRRLRVNNQFMLSRIMLSLTLTIAVLVAPAAPIEFSRIKSSHVRCSPAIQIDRCQRCPVNSNQTSSNSTCCSVQSPCFNYYSNATDGFVAGMASIAFKSQANDRFTFRSQRPPVPPPRFALS